MGQTSLKARSDVAGFHQKYALEEKLGKGAFAQVYRASDGESVDKAVKILDLRSKDKADISKLQASAYRETDVWQSVGEHAHIVELFEWFYDGEFCYMVMEMCSCSLFQHIDQAPEVNERFLGDLFVQMLHGISHVHSMRVVHRDIKPDNFIMGGDHGEKVKLCDFGLAKALPANGKINGVYGTAPFMCPEMLNETGYGEGADIWSIGVIAYALLFGDFPYVPKVPNSKAMKQAIIDGAPPEYEVDGQKRSEPAVRFISTLLDRNPETRPSATDALDTSYMFASSNKCHMLHQDLPSLRPMVYAAKRAGAFEVRDIKKETGADTLLRRMQSKLHTRKSKASSKCDKEQLVRSNAGNTNSSTKTDQDNVCSIACVGKENVASLQKSNDWVPTKSNDWATSKSNDWAGLKSNPWATSTSNGWAVSKSNPWATSKSNDWAASKSHPWANASSCSTVASSNSLPSIGSFLGTEILAPLPGSALA